METKKPAYTLNSSALDRALALLNKVEEDYQLTQDQRLAFTLLNVAVYAVGITLSIILIALLIASLKIVPGFFRAVANIVGYGLFAAGSTILVIIAGLFVLNFSFIRQFVRLNRLMSSLGLWYAFEAPWRAERKRKRVLNLLTAYLGPFFIVGSLLLALFYEALDPRHLGMMLSAGVAFIAMHLLRRGKERMDVIERLQNTFSEYRKEAGQTYQNRVDIRQADYDMFAKVERAYIARERAQSILASQQESSDDGYLVQKSHAFREEKAHLSPEFKSRTQRQIDALAATPRPEGAVLDPATGALRLRIANTPVHIDYMIDDDLRRIKLLSLEVDDDAPTESSSDE